jgi:hypothetical protein
MACHKWQTPAGPETGRLLPAVTALHARSSALQAVQRRASPELLEEADVEATLAAHREWVAAGRPGTVSHEEVMAELLREQ